MAHELSLTKIGFDSGRNRAGERTARKTLATSPTATLSAVFCNRERQRLNGLCQIAVNSRKCNLADSPLQRAGSTGHVQQFCLCHHRKCHITLQMPAWTSFVTSLHETEWSELICSYAYLQNVRENESHKNIIQIHVHPCLMIHWPFRRGLRQTLL